jgi:phosphohistidine phosphatase
MNLFVVRHAIAHEPDPSRWPSDRDRPLTDEGIRRFERCARGLARLASDVDVVLASPFVRTRETARILHEQAGWPAAVPTVELESGANPDRMLRALLRHASAARLAVVGHEPDLGDLCAHLLAADASRPDLAFEKGAAACLELMGRPKSGGASLLWFLPPHVLERLAAAND